MTKLLTDAENPSDRDHGLPACFAAVPGPTMARPAKA
jgi:hypothetical protein